MTIYIKKEPFDPLQEVLTQQKLLEKNAGFAKYGATAIFIGSMRDFNEDQKISEMTLEHYPGMTESALETICQEAQSKWPILDSLIVHRVGKINLNDSIVVVAVWSAHRGAAYDANRYIMEALKSKAPFWKKELTHNGAKWVDSNTVVNKL